MTSYLVTALAAAQLAAVFAPDTVLTPPEGPRIVVFGASPGEVAALRLSVPLAEGPAEAGVGHLLRDLALWRMESLARPVGARVAASRTPWGLAFSVEGAFADIEYLGYLLRQAVAEPDVTGVALADAHRKLTREAARTMEAPGPRVRDLLRRRIAPTLLPPGGTEASVAALDAARVREAWLRTHQPHRMTLVVSAEVAPEVLLAATRGMGAPPTTLTEPPDAPALAGEGRSRIQTLRTWYGRAWAAGSPADPHGPVAALLLAGHLEGRAAAFEVGVELWELEDRWAVAVTGAAYSAGILDLRAAVTAAVADTRAALTEEHVAHAVARVRRDLLLRARTPGGLTTVVGRAMEATGSPEAAGRYLSALDGVDVAAMDRFLADLEAGGAVEAEVRP